MHICTNDVASQLVNYFIIQYTMHMEDELIFVGHNICVVAGLKGDLK